MKKRMLKASTISVWLSALFIVIGSYWVLAGETMQISKMEVRDSSCFHKTEFNSDKSHVKMSMLIHDKPSGGAEKIEFVFQNTLAQPVRIRVWEDVNQSFMITYLLNGREISKPQQKNSTDNRVSKPLKEIFVSPGNTNSWMFEIKDYLKGNKLPDELIKGGNITIISSFYFSYSIEGEGCKSEFFNSSLDFIMDNVYLSPDM